MSNLTLALAALTGGGAGALDAIDGADLSDKDAAVVVLSTGVYHYHLDATSAASENSPYIIAPDDNPGDKRWVLMVPQAPFSHVYVSDPNGQTIPQATETKVDFTVEVYDYLNEFNLSTEEFIPKETGLYLVNVQYNYDTDEWLAGNDHFGVLDIDGSPHAYTTRGDISADIAAIRTGGAFSKVVPLTAAEVMTFAIQHSNVASVNLRIGAAWNWMTIDRLI
jgi:hypothetical protein